jgi:RNA polymerase sigma-70 factor (ECF subfamily)
VLADFKAEQFEQAVMPHLDAAYNLARWLTRNDHDAEDVIQDALLRAVKFFGGFRGENGRVWLLAIVRNTFFTWASKNARRKTDVSFDEERHLGRTGFVGPAAPLDQAESQKLVKECLEELPEEYREIMVLRELTGLSYKEIAGVANIPLGTVMSRLARARARMQESLAMRLEKEA